MIHPQLFIVNEHANANQNLSVHTTHSTDLTRVLTPELESCVGLISYQKVLGLS